MIAVSDTGVGMAPDVQARIFEPFFTTTPMGEGTGLGLATVFGVIEQSGGHIHVYSEVGIGTTFRIYLPAIEAAASKGVPEPEIKSLGGNETILLAEDDDALRGYAAEVLRNHEAEALLISEAQGDNIHLVVSDVVMPGMGGPELVEKLRPAIPRMRVLFIFGYTENAVVLGGSLDPGRKFLAKPSLRSSLD